MCHRGAGAPANYMSNPTYPTLLPCPNHKNYALAVAERVRADGRMEQGFTPSYGFRVLSVCPAGASPVAGGLARPSRSTG
jgi:hypothetical protein